MATNVQISGRGAGQDAPWRRSPPRRSCATLLGDPAPAALAKERTALHELDRQWLAASPVLPVATSGADGSCDVSPKGDPPGFTLVLDDTTIAIPERPGNRRADGYRNILANPHVGLIYLLPGPHRHAADQRPRPAGHATRPASTEMVVKGHRPVLAVVVEIEQVFHHCAQGVPALAAVGPGDLAARTPSPRGARIAQALERHDDRLEDLERYYGDAVLRRPLPLRQA